VKLVNIKSVDRAMQILFAFNVEDRLLGVSELSERLGLNQSTVHHLAASLKQWGLLDQDPVSRKYRLGLRLVELGGTMLHSRSLTRAIQPYLYHIAENLKETAYLGILVGRDSLNVGQADGPHLIQYAGWQGRRTPFYCSSAGKVLAAYLSAHELDELINHEPLKAHTPNTITDPAALREHLAGVKSQGYAMGIGELDENINAIAVPIRRIATNDSRVIAALAVSGPAYRFTREACLAAVGFLKSVGQEISNKVNTEDFNQLSV
jgi:IclR family transcriptional regulator, KDG regulon repressor